MIQPCPVHDSVEGAKVASYARNEVFHFLPLGEVALAVLTAKPL
jgi:hypothetical protein